MAYKAVPLQSLDQGITCVRIKQQPIGHLLHEVQVFESGLGFLTLLFGSPALVRGTLEVKLEVHTEHTRQNVVHHHDPDVLPAGLHAVQAKELGQQSARVLVQVLWVSKTKRRKH